MNYQFPNSSYNSQLEINPNVESQLELRSNYAVVGLMVNANSKDAMNMHNFIYK
ncbi:MULTISPECIES: hypothetical protein [Bacillus cereus group]|uniref:hypothetical protein n=1 Tax=Bacillus cereus group TaxID=86661 RepID=UPI0022E6D28B|nr:MULTISPECIES: hypothetical protein [unclassified Bacillus cereus group]MDA2231367.1 hypothetical protein [Bacillus cereus group sp. Bc227]MDA2264138.1 hypothetical protein [Bacillus cereus group sp. Bc200]